MRIELDEKELRERINLNWNRLLNDSYYTIDGIFSPSDYEWYGDKEGRALLAFVSHYKINREKIPCMEQLLEIAFLCHFSDKNSSAFRMSTAWSTSSTLVKG